MRFFWSEINIFSIDISKNSPFSGDHFDGKIMVIVSSFEMIRPRGGDKENCRIALVHHHGAKSVSLPTSTEFRSTAFIFGMTHRDDVIDDITKEL